MTVGELISKLQAHVDAEPQVARWHVVTENDSEVESVDLYPPDNEVLLS